LAGEPDGGGVASKGDVLGGQSLLEASHLNDIAKNLDESVKRAVLEVET
jgi:hypothetical protein